MLKVPPIQALGRTAMPLRVARGLCKTPVSFMKGAQAVARAFEEALGLLVGETSADGMFTLQWTSDIGMADQEPAALVNTTVLTELTPEAVPNIIAALKKRGAQEPIAREFVGFEPDPQLAHVPHNTVRSAVIRAGALLAPPFICGEGIRRAIETTPDLVIESLAKSRLRGRGGAGFPTAMKWRAARKAPGPQRCVVCNADEGEPGTFKDRVLLTDYADLVFDGMTVAGYALGAKRGIVYLRGEYAYLWKSLQETLKERRKSGLLGANILGRAGFDFEIRIQLGAGAYICGEESALLESLEGKRGAPRDRPPFPTERGYLAQPTAIDNVETFACVARIMERGALWFTSMGTSESTGSKLLCIAGDCPSPGVYEVPFGITLNQLLELVGAKDIQGIQVSGPSGQCIAPKDFGRRLAYEDLSTGGSTMLFGAERDLLAVALQFSGFFVDESCGWCVPCRVGTTELKRGMQKICDGRATLADVLALQALAGTVSRMSRCGLGQTAPNPILSTMRNFPELYEKRLQVDGQKSSVSLEDALQEAKSIRADQSQSREV
jgi:[NiFe] hydrogenase diaphorase moiety large subunit